ncbi:methyltransferase-like protein 27 [Branchiostoma lanceolatum]|uniref:methyltransferase-like protein 27 n=1 Tax=Branchiostoma lanceolatum TaxID=7740 RepID=UPI00345401B1
MAQLSRYGSGKSAADVFEFLDCSEECRTEDAQNVYSTWAANYDQDMTTFGYQAPQQLVSVMHGMLGGVNPSNVRVLDVAAGTGMVGSELQKLGYTNADGLDANPDMLKVAENKHVYQRLIEAKLGTGQLPVAPDTYDAVLIVGAFTPNWSHLQPECFEELVQITKPGGFIIVGTSTSTLASDIGKAMEAKLRELQERSLLSIVDKPTRPMFFKDWEGTFFVCKVT